MQSPVIVRASTRRARGARRRPAPTRNPAREAVYYTTASSVWRADLNAVTPTSAIVATDAGTNLRGLTARYDGNGAVTLPGGEPDQDGRRACLLLSLGDGACTVLGAVASLKYARAVALDTNGNAYAVNEDLLGAEQLLYVPRNLACSGQSTATGCLPGGYAAPVVVDDRVDGSLLVTDVKVVSGVGSLGAGAKYGPGDVLVLAEWPARMLAYSHTAIAAYLAARGPGPSRRSSRATSTARSRRASACFRDRRADRRDRAGAFWSSARPASDRRRPSSTCTTRPWGWQLEWRAGPAPIR